MYRRLLPALGVVALAMTAAQAQSGRYLSATFNPEVNAELLDYGTNVSVLPVVLGQSEDPQPQTLRYRLVTPAGDDATNRPVVIIHHTGSYMPIALNGGLTGSINDAAPNELAQRFAAIGYVALIPEYRQGWNTTAPDVDEQTSTLLIASLRGGQDLHMMTRYLRKTVAEDGNPLGIDPDRIMAVGLGTGGYNVLNANYLDRVSEVNDLDKFIDSRNNLPYYDSSLYGNPFGTDQTPLNNPTFVDYESGFAFGASLGGAMGDESWIEGKESEAPVATMHSIVDGNAPFDVGNISVPTTGNIVLQESPGARRVVQVATEAGGPQLRINAVHDALASQDDPITLRIEALENTDYTTVDGTETTLAYDNMYPFVYGEDTRFANEYNYADTNLLSAPIRGLIEQAQLPFTFEQLVQLEQASNRNFLNPDGARMYLDTVMRFLVPRAYAVMDLEALVNVVDVEAADVGFQVFPSPASASATISVDPAVELHLVTLYDAQGRQVASELVEDTRFELDVTGLPTGLYRLRAQTSAGAVTQPLMVTH